MNTESPFEGNVPSGGEEPSYEWLDEWLCEYVDGTMDPSLEAVFEQYVEANPELKAHVQRLQKTRDLLYNCSLPKEPSADVEEEVCQEVEETMQPSTSEMARNGSVAALGLVSAVTVALVVGFLVGAVVVGPLPEGTVSVNRVASEAPGASGSQPAQTTDRAPFGGRLYHSSGPLSPADSVQSPSSLTKIGFP